MIFEELSVFLKASLSCPNCSSSVKELFFLWMKSQLEKDNLEQSNCSKVLQSEFRIVNLAKEKNFIVPKSQRAVRLLKFLNQYLEVMQEDYDLKKSNQLNKTKLKKK